MLRFNHVASFLLAGMIANATRRIAIFDAKCETPRLACGRPGRFVAVGAWTKREGGYVLSGNSLLNGFLRGRRSGCGGKLLLALGGGLFFGFCGIDILVLSA